MTYMICLERVSSLSSDKSAFAEHKSMSMKVLMTRRIKQVTSDVRDGYYLSCFEAGEDGMTFCVFYGPEQT